MNNNNRPRVAQVKSFQESSLSTLDEKVNNWIIRQTQESRINGNGYSTKNIQYLTSDKWFIATVTYIVNAEVRTR